MFESLTTKLQNITGRMRGKARVTDADIKEMMHEIRMALLEADVNYGVVKEFIADMTEKCSGSDIQSSLPRSADSKDSQGILLRSFLAVSRAKRSFCLHRQASIQLFFTVFRVPARPRQRLSLQNSLRHPAKAHGRLG